MKHIILIGFMGSGKSRVGAELANKLRRLLYDNDELVVQKCGMSIADLMESRGENHFRNLELETFEELLSKQPGIIATGGGIVNTEARRKLLREADAHVIWLKTDFETSARRVSQDSKNVRPLFADQKKAKDLFQERQKLYESVSDITVNANKEIEEVVDQILAQLPQRCYIIGDPVSHSFSPYLHNAVYSLLGIDEKFHFDAERVAPADLASAVERMRAQDVRGVSVTVPHKIAIIEYLDEVDPLAQKIGAVNTIVNQDGHLHGYNTDAEGVLLPLLERTKTNDLHGKKVLIVGAGGAARAAAFACANAHGIVTITNRTPSKAESLAQAVNGLSATFEEATSSIAKFDIIFNATSVGMGEAGNSNTPLPGISFRPGQIVFDAVYSPHETQLLRDARANDAETIYGLEMLGHQAIGQIKRYTGHDIDVETVMNILKEKLQP